MMRRGAVQHGANQGPWLRLPYSPELTAAALGLAVAAPALLFPIQADWMESWLQQADLFLSVWTLGFVLALATLWGAGALHALSRADGPQPGALPTPETRPPAPALPWRWALVLLALCTLETASHSGERNGWLASSRPTSWVETWTTADGYAMVLDGVIAQGDGQALLPMLALFGGDGPPAPSEFDRRAGHVYLVSLLERPLGGYWSFAATSVLAWWAAALAVWWLGARRWPGTLVPWLASLFTATGLGFTFVAAAPQAHGVALASLALLLALADRLPLWEPVAAWRSWLRSWAGTGWAAGASGLVYLAYIPGLLFFWLYGASRAEGRRDALRWAAGAAAGSVVALALVQAWVWYGGGLLGLSFAGGNNDLVGAAARNWVSVARQGSGAVVGQLHADSLRGIFAGAFYYPWWPLAAVGIAASGRDNRRWLLAVVLAVALPTIAFSTRFGLPRVAYFMYPAMYLAAARGVDVASGVLPGRAARWLAACALAALLVALSNLDLAGLQQLNLWFHYSQGNGW